MKHRIPGAADVRPSPDRATSVGWTETVPAALRLATALALLLVSAAGVPAQDRPVVIEPLSVSDFLPASAPPQAPSLLESLERNRATEPPYWTLQAGLERPGDQRGPSTLQPAVSVRAPSAHKEVYWADFWYGFTSLELEEEREARVWPASDSYAFQVAQQVRTKAAMERGVLNQVDFCFHKPDPDPVVSNHTVWAYLHPDEGNVPGPAFAEKPLNWTNTWTGAVEGRRHCFQWPLPDVAFAPDQVFWISVAWRGDRGREQEGLAGKAIMMEANSANSKRTRVVSRKIAMTGGDLTFGDWAPLTGVYSVAIWAHVGKALDFWRTPEAEEVVEYRYNVDRSGPRIAPPERADQAMEVAQRFRLREPGVVRWVQAAFSLGSWDHIFWIYDERTGYSRFWFDIHSDSGGRPGPSLLGGPAPRVASAYGMYVAGLFDSRWLLPRYGDLSVSVPAGDVWVSVRWLHPGASAIDGLYSRYVRGLLQRHWNLGSSYFISDDTEVVGRLVDIQYPGGIEHPGESDPQVVRAGAWKPMTDLPSLGGSSSEGDFNAVAITMGVDHSSDTPPPPDPPPPPPPGSECAADTPVLTFDGGYSVGMCWEAPDGKQGRAIGGPWSSQHAGLLYFFEEENPEVLVKVLDGCVVNGHRWVFVAPVTDLTFNLQVTSPGGATWIHTNQQGATAEARGDTAAFPCTVSEIAAAGGFDAPDVVAAAFRSPLAGATDYPAPPVSVRSSSWLVSPSTSLLDLDGYTVSMSWRAPDGQAGEAKAGIWESTYAGMLWFFDKANPEVLVKVLDGCAVNGYRWVFVAPVTTLQFDLTVTAPDGTTWRHTNAQGRTASTKSDTAAFKCA